jgi:ATP/maltotriose-dependent transcriptional regulator MalT
VLRELWLTTGAQAIARSTKKKGPKMQNPNSKTQSQSALDEVFSELTAAKPDEKDPFAGVLDDLPVVDPDAMDRGHRAQEPGQ